MPPTKWWSIKVTGLLVIVEENFEKSKSGSYRTTSNMGSVRILSNMALKPRAPVFFAIAFLAINLSALSVKCNLTCNNNIRRQ